MMLEDGGCKDNEERTWCAASFSHKKDQSSELSHELWPFCPGLVLEVGSPGTGLAGLEFLIFLPKPPKRWDAPAYLYPSF